MATEKKVRRVKDVETLRERANRVSNAKKETPNKKSKYSIIKENLSEKKESLSNKKGLKPVFKILHIIGRILLPKYIRESFKELKLVSWPSLKQGIKLTYAVVMFAVIFGMTIAFLDWGLSKLFKHILLR